MARTTVVLETITCDVCGQVADAPESRAIGLGRDIWELDLCPTHLAEVDAQFRTWTAGARRVKSTGRPRGRREAASDWAYLESLGFTRHRGRKTANEIAALASRDSAQRN